MLYNDFLGQNSLQAHDVWSLRMHNLQNIQFMQNVQHHLIGWNEVHVPGNITLKSVIFETSTEVMSFLDSLA